MSLASRIWAAVVVGAALSPARAAWADIMQGGMTPQAAAEKAFKRVEEIFAKYPIA